MGQAVFGNQVAVSVDSQLVSHSHWADTTMLNRFGTAKCDWEGVTTRGIL